MKTRKTIINAGIFFLALLVGISMSMPSSSKQLADFFTNNSIISHGLAQEGDGLDITDEEIEKFEEMFPDTTEEDDTEEDDTEEDDTEEDED